jgi:hypothetical protein
LPVNKFNPGGRVKIIVGLASGAIGNIMDIRYDDDKVMYYAVLIIKDYPKGQGWEDRFGHAYYEEELEKA